MLEITTQGKGWGRIEQGRHRIRRVRAVQSSISSFSSRSCRKRKKAWTGNPTTLL